MTYRLIHHVGLHLHAFDWYQQVYPNLTHLNQLSITVMSRQQFVYTVKGK